MGKYLPRWSVALFLISISLVAFGSGNLENSYSEVWSNLNLDDGDAYWNITGPYDMDGDGKKEFVVLSDFNTWVVYVYESTGDNEFALEDSLSMPGGYASYVAADNLCDMNGDGVNELIVAGTVDAAVAVGDEGVVFILEVDTTVAVGDLKLNVVAGIDPREFGTVETGRQVRGVWAGDVDGDGRDELLMRTSSSAAFKIISLDAGSTWDFPAWTLEFENIATTSSVYDILVADFDHDGGLEIALPEYDFMGIAFYDVVGPDDYALIHFTDDLSAGDGGGQRGAAAGDIDGDGYVEILVADNNTGGIFIYTNTGDLTAIQLDTLSQNTWYRGAALGNTDVWRGTPDGMDFIATDYEGNIWDFEYEGGDVTDPASWTEHLVYSTGDAENFNLQDVAIGDFDSDGLDDIIAVMKTSAYVVMIEHDGWDWVSDITTYHVAADTSAANVTPGDQVRGIMAGSDVDQDGHKEVIITDYTIQGVHIYESTDDNTLEWVATLSNSDTYLSTPTGITTGDLDGNGRDEIIFMLDSYNTTITEDMGIQAWEWDGVVGSDTYVKSVLKIVLASTGVEVDRYRMESSDLVVGDVDGDGVQEICLANDGSSGTNNDFFLIASVDGSFDSGIYDLTTEWIADRTTLIGGSPGRGAPAIADLQGDGAPEVIFNNWDNGATHIIQSTGIDTYEHLESFNLDSAVTDKVTFGSLHVTDIDGDGKDDVFGGLYSAGWLWQLHGSADLDSISYDNGKLSRIAEYSAAWSVTGGDVTGDGVDEIFSVDYAHGRTYQWEYNAGAWDMSVVANYPNTMGGFALDFAEDLDGDGKPELVQGFLVPPYDTYITGAGNESNDMGYIIAVHEFGVVTVVDTDNNWKIITPDDYQLSQAYPNPFNPSTTIEFTLPLAKDNVNVIVYNMLGQEVVRLANNASYSAGTHSVTWNSLTANGTPAAAGIYIYELRSGNVSKTAKMTLIK